MPKKSTGQKAASAAGKVLADENQDKNSKTAAASALSQTEPKKRKRRSQKK